MIPRDPAPDDEGEADPIRGRGTAPREAPGSMVGHYKLLEEIGEGGFAIVYLAEQKAPVRKRVAVKVLKPGMDTREIVARFEVERQTLALMDHPNVAQVHDGGATDSGRPYFVMELVKGQPITRYCRQHGLSIRQRLELFLDVLAAVQHAHQKGVIHRDLKPSNILVTAHEGKPVVKVIDFGIAKVMSMELAGWTTDSFPGRMIGTPQYMSPEQAEWNVPDIDTRSDVYSLGVVLYELLTGTTPLDPTALRAAGFSEIQRLIQEEKPPRPSVRIASLRQQEKHGQAPPAAPSGGRGPAWRELDWVVMQALEKDRVRRYQTVNALAQDVRRLLDDEPVTASPPSNTYRLTKFAKRHRFGVAWTAVFSLVVIAAAIGMTALYLQKKREAEKAVLARQQAQVNAWDALVSQAKALRWSETEMRRFKAQEALNKAAGIRAAMPDLKLDVNALRNETIACLAMNDIKPLESWEGNPERGGLVSADPKMERYACTSSDGTITIFRYPNKISLKPLPGKAKPVALRFSRDGKRLAAVCRESEASKVPESCRLTLWTIEDASSLELGPVANQAFAFFPENRERCAVGRPDGAIEVLECRDGSVVKRFERGGPAVAIQVNRNGALLAVARPPVDGRAGLVEVLDARSGDLLESLSCPEPLAVAWGTTDDTEESLAVGCGDGVVRLWAAQEWDWPPRELRGHTREVDAVVWSPDGRLIASQGLDGMTRLWDAFQTGVSSWHPGRGSDLAFSADGSRLGLLCNGPKLTVMEVVRGDVCHRGSGHRGQAGVADAVWSSDGKLMASCGDDGVRFWNREGRQVGRLKLRAARGFAFWKDWWFVASDEGLFRRHAEEKSENGGITVELGQAERIGTFSGCRQLALCAKGEKHVLAVAARRDGEAADPAVWLLDPAQGSPPHRLPAPGHVAYCALSPDGEWLAAGTSGGHGVRVWSVSEAAVKAELPVYGSAKVVFSPGGNWLVTGDTEAYRFWKVGARDGAWRQDDRELKSGMANSHGMMAFSPRYSAFAIACSRDELKVLKPFRHDGGKGRDEIREELKSEQLALEELATPDFDREAPLCFDPMGRLMVTTGRGGGLFFWKLDELRERLKMGKVGKETLDWPQLRELEYEPPTAIFDTVHAVVVKGDG